MLALAVITLRLVQYGAAAVLMGSSLFLLVVLPKAGGSCAERLSWPRNLLAVAAAVLALASGVGLIAQTAGLAGSISEALSPSVLGSVITTMNMGPSSLTRAGVGVLALILLLPRKPTELGWWATALLGAVGCASFAWMGHGAATEGMGHGLHLAADIIHGFAASMWIGALAGFLCLLGQPTDPGHDHVLHLALEGFAGLGSALVAIILGTGLINSWFLVGPDHWRTVLMVPYGGHLKVCYTDGAKLDET